MRFVLFACLFTLFMPMMAAETSPGPLPAGVVRVTDGDTIGLRARIWLGQTAEAAVRLARIDASELSRAACEEERARGETARTAAMALAGDRVTLKSIEHDTYAGRVAAEAATEAGVVLSGALVAQGRAAPMEANRPRARRAEPVSAGFVRDPRGAS